MSMLSDYLENALIDTVLRGQSYTGGNVYVGLFTSDPKDDGTGTEVSGNSYERQKVAFKVPLNGETYNDSDVLFPIATEDWGIIAHIGLFDSQADGNLLFHAPLEFEKTINISSQFKIPKDYLIIRLK